MVVITRRLPKDKKIGSFFINDSLQKVLSGFKNAVEKYNTSAVILIDGRSGLGKTTLANQAAIYLDKDYDINKMHYNPRTFLEGSDEKIGLNTIKPGSCIVFDEAMILSSRSSMTEINKMIVQAMSMIRSKRIYVLFCVNAIFDLDRNLAISRADVLLHVYGQNLIDRGKFGAFFKAKDGMDRLKGLYLHGKKWYDYSKPKANFIGTFPKEFVVNEDEYEIQKQKSVNEFLMGTKKRRNTNITRTRNRLIYNLHKEKKFTTAEISNLSGISVSYVREIVREFNDDPQNYGKWNV